MNNCDAWPQTSIAVCMPRTQMRLLCGQAVVSSPVGYTVSPRRLATFAFITRASCVQNFPAPQSVYVSVIRNYARESVIILSGNCTFAKRDDEAGQWREHAPSYIMHGLGSLHRVSTLYAGE